MRPFTSTISLDEARRRLHAAVRPVVRTERVRLADAMDRVAASGVTSCVDVPPFARSAMDGYAVIAADTKGGSREKPTVLRLIDRIYAGGRPEATVTPGTCAEIATGAPLPDGADAVVMVEETSAAGDHTIHVFASVAAGQNVGRRAADIAAGDCVVREGDFLTAGRVGAIAAAGVADVEVYVRPTVSILSTGNEVTEPGAALGPSQIYDVNRFTIGAIVSAHGGIASPQRAARDTIDSLMHAIDAAADADIIVFSGGSSVGDRDFVVDMIAERGSMIFHGLAVKPGKPTAFARVGNSAFLGLPGNPASCLSNAYVLLVPFLRATARLPPYSPRTVSAPLSRRLVSVSDRHQFYTVRLQDGLAHPAFKGSGDITSLSQADGYIEIEAGTGPIEKGTIVEIKLF
jgi:molybdenum cofactor synthesis domain-containing protein